MKRKLSTIDVGGTLERARVLVREDQTISSSVRAIVELLVVIIEILCGRLGINSRNSSKPPSQDPERTRGRHKAPGEKDTGKRKPGGQPGHKGETIERVPDPDHVEEILIDRRTIPTGMEYSREADDVRQVIDIEIRRRVTEYRGEVLRGPDGTIYRATFPEGVTRSVQYGESVKAEAAYMSIYQLLPYGRVQNYFADQAGICLSAGTLCSVNQEAYERLGELGFEDIVRARLIASPVAHFDETGLNVKGKLHWLHSASTELWTLYGIHEKRGRQGIEDLGVLPVFTGIACHDHWKPYFTYAQCTHALCNAHHLRELQGVIDNEGFTWAKNMKDLLGRIVEVRQSQESPLTPHQQGAFRRQYRQILEDAESECPELKQKGVPTLRRLKQSKARNLLTRLRDFEEETLRFLTCSDIPFTNNQSERDIRMTKVQQKISGCFRSLDGAKAFARVRSYISTCLKHGTSATEALRTLFAGKLPDFFNSA